MAAEGRLRARLSASSLLNVNKVWREAQSLQEDSSPAGHLVNLGRMGRVSAQQLPQSVRLHVELNTKRGILAYMYV